MSNRQATFVICHGLDSGAKAVIAEVLRFAGMQIVDPYFLISVSSATQAELGDFDAVYVSEDGSEQCKLLDRLSRVGSIDNLRITCINAASEELDEQISLEIAESLARIRVSLDQLLGASISVSEVRVGIRGFGESLPCIKFFPINSTKPSSLTLSFEKEIHGKSLNEAR